MALFDVADGGRGGGGGRRRRKEEEEEEEEEEKEEEEEEGGGGIEGGEGGDEAASASSPPRLQILLLLLSSFYFSSPFPPLSPLLLPMLLSARISRFPFLVHPHPVPHYMICEKKVAFSIFPFMDGKPVTKKGFVSFQKGKREGGGEGRGRRKQKATPSELILLPFLPPSPLSFDALTDVSFNLTPHNGLSQKIFTGRANMCLYLNFFLWGGEEGREGEGK